MPDNLGLLIGGGILSVILFVLLILVAVILYPKVKTKAKGSYLPDVLFVFGYAILNIINICIITVFYLQKDSSLSNGFNMIRFFDAIASTVATFSFNSIESGKEIANNVYNNFGAYLSLSMYYLLPLNLGIMLFTIASYNLAFEFNSSMHLLNAFTKRDVYIFSSLTDDSIALAKKIKETVGKESIIFFYGSNLPQFDKKDPLCKEVMINGFYYRSTSKNKPFGVLKSNRNKKYYFAMELDSKLKPNENLNASDVFNSIENDNFSEAYYYILVSDKSDINSYQDKYSKLTKNNKNKI